MFVEVHGLNHTTASVEVREKVWIPPDRLTDALVKLRRFPQVEQCLILSTCNRTEVYVARPKTHGTTRTDKPGVDFLVQYCGIAADVVQQSLYHLEGEEAVAHLFRVAAGLDSMVLGENEILGQVRTAFAAACEAECTGSFLSRMLHTALQVGKEVRTRTALNEGSLSVSHTACDLAQERFGRLSNAAVLVIGAGETGEQAARDMQARGVKQVTVTNRTLQRATPLAQCLCCEVLPFQHLETGLQNADIVISCTASEEPILTRKLVAEALNGRSESRHLLIVDLAVPRDVEQSVGTLPGIELFNIDDLQSVVQANIEKRRAEAVKALVLVEQASEKFAEWQKSLIAVPTIRDLQTLFNRIQKEELDRWANQVSPEEFERIKEVSAAITRRIAQLAISRMKEASAKPNAHGFIESVQRLFDLEKPER